MFSVSVISTDTNYSRVIKKCFFKGEYSAFCIMDICSVNMNCEEISHSICYYVPLSSFRFFPPSNPRFSLLYTVFTLCASIRTYVGFSLFPFVSLSNLYHTLFFYFLLSYFHYSTLFYHLQAIGTAS